MPEGVKLPIGQLYQANYDEHLAALRAVCKSLCHQYNQLDPGDREAQMEILRRLLGTVGKEAEVMPPIWFDYGCNVHLGEKFYSNHGLIITDGAEVRFGDNVFVGPNCCFTTAEHPIDPELRVEGLEIALPITVGSRVWLGAGCTVLAGVTIGDNAVIGAGSVVTHDIPANVVAVGVPCRVMRAVTEADKRRWPLCEP